MQYTIQYNIQYNTIYNTTHNTMHNILQYNTIQRNIQYSAVQYARCCTRSRTELLDRQGTREASTATCRQYFNSSGEKKYNNIYIYILQYNTIQRTTIHYSTIQYSPVQYSTIEWALLHALEN